MPGHAGPCLRPASEADPDPFSGVRRAWRFQTVDVFTGAQFVGDRHLRHPLHSDAVGSARTGL